MMNLMKFFNLAERWRVGRERRIAEATAELVALCKKQGWALAYKENILSPTNAYRRYRLEQTGGSKPVLHAFTSVWKGQHTVHYFMETVEVLRLMPCFAGLRGQARFEALEGLRVCVRAGG